MSRKEWGTKAITYHLKNDKHIIEHINKQLPNGSRYVLGLIEKDMMNQGENITYDEKYIRDIVEKMLKDKGLI